MNNYLYINVWIFLLLFSLKSYADGREDMKINGNFIYQYDETKSSDDAVAKDQHRIVAALNVSRQLNDVHFIGLRLVSGSNNRNHNYQPLDEAFSTKAINLDLAYFESKFFDMLTISGGKLKNPFIRAGGSQLIFDKDLHPEGLYAKFQHDFGDLLTTVTSASFVIDQRAPEKENMMLYAGQFAIGTVFSGIEITFGYSTYIFDQIESAPTIDQDSKGNSTQDPDAENLTYMNPYELTNTFIQIINQGAPWSVWVDNVENSSVSKDNAGVLFGLSYGKALYKSSTPYKISLNQRQVEKDAVLGSFTDATFNNGRGSDVKGIELAFAYAVDEALTVETKYYGGTYPIKDGEDFARTQFSLKFKF